jgi:hypothetical protein
MAGDFGGGGRSRWRRGERLDVLRRFGGYAVMATVFVLFAALPTSMTLSLGQPPGPVAAAPEGKPPCRQISHASFLRGWREAPHVIHFQGAAFARRRGDIFCGVRRDGLFGKTFPVCELDAPVQLGVTVDELDTYWDVGPGWTAVVEARPEGPRCVVTGRYLP